MTQSTDVFRTMSPEEAEALFQEMRDELRPVYKQAERVAADTLRLRPVFLGKQPFPKRARMMRKALSLKVNAEATSEVLAMFFIERYPEDLAELLDAFGLEHEEGVLKDSAPEQPAAAKIEKAVKTFPAGKNALMRGLLLRAFAAQSAIDWPVLDQLVFEPGEARPAEPAPAGKPVPAAKPAKAEKPGKGEKPAKGKKSGKAEKSAKGEKPGKAEKPAKPAKPAKAAKTKEPAKTKTKAKAKTKKAKTKEPAKGKTKAKTKAKAKPAKSKAKSKAKPKAKPSK